jgi:hypothetical protein
VRLDGAYGDQVVRLRKGIPVRITLRGAIPRPSSRSDRIAVALLRGAGRQMVLGGMGTFEDPKETAFLVASPGTYEVAWYLDSGQSRKYLTGGTTRTVEVRDTDVAQEIALEFPSEVLAAIK